jgi:hypothetical protein
MVFTLKIPTELEQRLREAARDRGLTVDAFTIEVLEQQIPRSGHRKELVSLLQAWINEPDMIGEDQAETALIQALNEDRLSDRPLFPPELKGITW